MTKFEERIYRQFRAVNYPASTSLQYARALAWADDNGLTFRWENEPIDRDEWEDIQAHCKDCRHDRHRIERCEVSRHYQSHDHTSEVCILTNADNDYLQVVGGFIDADKSDAITRAFRLSSEGDLALEEMARVEELEKNDRDAKNYLAL